MFMPVNQVRHTNIAVVRMKAKGKRFEIACYKNKVVNWRNGVEKDIDEVLQSQMVFMNVSKGQAANKKDLKKYFGTEDHTAVCIKILDGGVLQVSDKEREVEYANMFRDIAMRVADMCVNPESNRPYTLGVIDRSMRETLHYAVKPSKSAKLQALEVVRLLQKHMPITRAQIKIRASFPGGSGESESRDPLEVLVADLKRLGVTNHTPVDGQPGVIDVLIDPGHYRVVDEMVTKRSAGVLEVLDLCVQETGDVAIEDESVRRQHLGGGRVLQRGNNSGEGSDRAVGGEAQDQDGEDGVLEEGQAAGGVRTLPLAAPEEAVGMKKKKKKKKRGRRQNNHDDEWEREIKADSVLARAANDDKATGTGCSDATGAGASAGASASASVSAGAGAGSGASAGAGGIAGFRCTSCAGSSFADKTEHREHFRSEWHRVNLKLKLKKLPPLTQAEYEDMAGDDVSMFLKQLT